MTLKKIFPLTKKKKPAVPMGTDWRDYKGEVNSPLIGVVIPDNVIVFDLDTYKGVSKEHVETALECKLEWDNAELQQTLKGGTHYAFHVPSGVSLKNGTNVLGVEGFDTRSSGKGYIATGEGYKDLTLYGVIDTLYEHDSFPNLPNIAVDKLKEIESESDELGDFSGLITNDSMDKAQVLQLLDKLDPSMDNDNWVKVGMALHDWHPKEGLRLWEQWSRAGDNYEEGETAKRWRSFKTGQGTSLGSLVYMSQSSELTTEEDLVEEMRQRIRSSSAVELKLNVAKDIRKMQIDNINREALGKVFQDRFKVLTGAKPPISVIRNMLMPSVDPNSDEIFIPEWVKGWVLVNSSSSFYNFNTHQNLRPMGFNMEYSNITPFDSNGRKQSACNYIEKNGFIEVVSDYAYLPMMDKGVCSIGNKKVVNTFDQTSVPLEAIEYSEEGLKAIKHIKKHIKLLCGDAGNGRILLQWLAFQVQYPGKKIPWSPIIQSIQGVGKTFLAKMMAAALGHPNVGVVSPQVVVSQFNAWATGVSLNILEELKIAGHNRFEAANALKPLVSDETITINPKGMGTYTTLNTTNYIVFTNYKDAIPLEDSDRRWWVIFVQLSSLEDIEKKTGIDKDVYFDKLWNAVNNYGPEIRKWLLEYEISDEFKAMKTAPMTQYKASMIATEKAGHEYVQEIEDLIKEGGKFFCEEAISSKHLFEVAEEKIDDFYMPSTRKKTQLLKFLGYSQMEKRVKVKGDCIRVWTKSDQSPNDVKKLFE